jgi:Cys-tRNA(Pro)/Cys-tRNA(Cys) deacylase
VGRKTSRQQGGTPALLVLQNAGVAHVAHPYEHDPASTVGYGLEAAAVLGVSPDRVFKTLVADVDGALVCAIVPVESQLDLKALAKAVGGKRAAMADAARAERATGYVVGGISPLGQRQSLVTVLDRTAHEHRTIFVSGGRRGLDVELAPADLVRLTDARVEPVRRAPSDPAGRA